MKAHQAWIFYTGLAALVALGVLGASNSEAANEFRFGNPVKMPWGAAKRTATRTHWQSVTLQTNHATLRVHGRTNRFVEIGAGLNVQDAEGRFIPADASFVITATGAESRGAAHQVIVPGNIGSGVGIKVVTPNGEELVFQPLAVDYFDPVDGRGVLIDVITNAVGYLTASNEIVFSNCFTTLKASIRLRNTRAGLESDLVLHERPPDPETLGLSSLARLEMLTEQLAGAVPSRRESFIHRERDPARINSMVEPDFIDTELTFGDMKMTVGRAYLSPAVTNAASMSSLSSRVGKSFFIIEERRVLVEGVEHRRSRKALHHLPAATNLTHLQASISAPGRIERLAKNTRSIPPLASQNESREATLKRINVSPIRQAKYSVAAKPSPLVATTSVQPAFILDYYLVYELSLYGETDFTFRGDTTYLVSSQLGLNGTTTIEGGTVVKFSEGSGLILNVNDTIVCDTTNYLPAVFTSFDDNSVGENLGGSGSLAQCNTFAFYFIEGIRKLNDVRFTHIALPIMMENSGGASEITLRNVQALNAAYVIETGVTTVNVFNGLFKDCGYVYSGSASFTGEHMTVHNATDLGFGTSATIRNSLLVAIQNPPSYVGTYTEIASTNLSSATNVFETVEGGEHYLPTNSLYRNIGTNAIDASLAHSLSNLTTYAPTLLTGTNTTNTTLQPVVSADSDAPDLGYHYPVVDYVAKDFTVQNVSLSLSGGVVVASAFVTNEYWTAAVNLNPGRLESIGTPDRLNRILRANQVQENVQTRGGTVIGDGNTGASKAVLRFSDFSSLAGEDLHVFLGSNWDQLEASHNQFFNGRLYFKHYGGIYQTNALTNNLLRSVHFAAEATSPAWFYSYNNTFKDGMASFTGGNPDWLIKDNVFDTVELSQDSATITSDFNGYFGMTNRLTADTSYVSNTVFAYTNGALGKFYHLSTHVLNQGSRNATNAGLYHFTVKRDQQAETNSVVDIGFHYLSLTADDAVKDTDGDGVVDYLEDVDGTGSFGGPDQTDWKIYNTLFGSGVGPALETFTPLKPK